MKRIVLLKGKRGPQLIETSEVSAAPGEALLKTLETAIDGTDEEIIAGEYGEFPPGDDFLTLGHEALGEVVVAPLEGDLIEGDLVTPTVRRGCGICIPCNTGRSDFCQTGLYRERGIRGLHGYMAQSFAERAEYLVKVPRNLREIAVLTEPLSIAEKALEQAVGLEGRLPWAGRVDPLRGKSVLILGTGPLGLLVALLARLGGARALSADRTSEEAPSSRLITRLGLRHVDTRQVGVDALIRSEGAFDLIVEATGAPQVPFQYLKALTLNGVMVLLGVPSPAEPFPIDGSAIMKRMVLGNQILVGCVNSNVHHFRLSLAHMPLLDDNGSLHAIITHRLPLPEFKKAFDLQVDSSAVKRVILWA